MGELSKKVAIEAQLRRIEIEMRKVKDEIRMKNQQIASLEKQMTDLISASQSTTDKLGLSPSYDELLEQLNEKSFLEVKTADNRIIQDQLHQKISECGGLRDTVTSLKQLALALDTKSSHLNAKPQHMNKGNSPSRDITVELLQQAHMAQCPSQQ